MNFWIFFEFYSFTSSRPEVFLKNAVLKIYSKFTREDPCRSATSIRFLGNFIEISLRHGCSPVNLMDIFKTAFAKKTSGRLLLFFNLRVTLLLCLSVIVTVIKVYPEAVPRKGSSKKILKNSQNPQENTCTRVSFLKRLWYSCFPVNFAKFLRTTLLKEHLRCLLLFIHLHFTFSHVKH